MIMIMNLKLIIFALVISYNINAQHEECFADVQSPYVYFSSRTSYAASGKSLINIPQNCTPIYLWALIRHGTRYPNKIFITSMNDLYGLRDAIIQNHKEKRGKLCAKDLSILKRWNHNVTSDLAHELTSQGLQDEISLAQRLKNKFPTLLTLSTKNSFVFQSSGAKRAKDSAFVFRNELLGENYKNPDGNRIVENDYLLHFGKHSCPHAEETDNNSSVSKEVELFQQSDMMQKVISEISIRLGFQYGLSFKLVKLMYHMCAYESAWYLNSRPAFCAAFLPEHLKVFEYLDDMRLYYTTGYGNPFSKKIGCPIVQNMMISLNNAAKHIMPKQKATFYFSHSEMILPTIVKLGLNRDDKPLKHDNYNELKESRKWRLAFFDSFAANIITVLHKCTHLKDVQYKVILYENEHEVDLSKCSKKPCLLEDLLQHFPNIFNKNQCDQKFCENYKKHKSKLN